MRINYNANIVAEALIQKNRTIVLSENTAGIKAMTSSVERLFTALKTKVSPSVLSVMKGSIAEELFYKDFEERYFPLMREEHPTGYKREIVESTIAEITVFRKICDQDPNFYRTYFADILNGIPQENRESFLPSFMANMKTILIEHVKELIPELQQAYKDKKKIYTPTCSWNPNEPSSSPSEPQTTKRQKLAGSPDR